MGGLCSKKTREVRVHELAFMGLCTEGAYNNPGLMDEIFRKAEEAGHADQIFNAKDDDGDLPIHKAALMGNPTVIEWIIAKWKDAGHELDINVIDHNGYTPLYLTCYKGQIGVDSPQAGIKAHLAKQKRMETIQLLINHGAEVNYQTPKLKMTPLHWAAYSGEADIVKLLLDNGAA